MHHQSSTNEQTCGLLHPLPPELVLVGRYVSVIAHLETLPHVETVERAWAAGFFDGEGCTFLGHHGYTKTAVPCCEVNQIDREVLDRFRCAVAALGTVRIRPDKRENRSSTMWSYTTRNWRDTQAVLTLLWPFLSRVKRDQAARVFTSYQECVTLHPLLGRPSTQALWTQTMCPYGHTDIYVRLDKRGHRLRKCRTCRRSRQSTPYRDIEGASQQASGERNGQAKLTAERVQQIRTRHASGDKQNAMAAEYGIPKQTINNIVLRRSWRHLL